MARTVHHDRPIHVVHAPYDVGGNSYFLSRGERANGADSLTLVYFSQWFGYPVDRNLRISAGKDPLPRIRWWIAMLRVALTADVVHFNFGGSFLSDVSRGRIFLDLGILRELGIATFITFQGCDSRISWYALERFATNACQKCRSRGLCDSTYNIFKQEVIAQLPKYFDGVFALNPDLLHNIPLARFLPYSNCDLDDWRPDSGFDWFHAGPVRVLHAPTWRELKGTDEVVETVRLLQKEGLQLELILVENIPHADARSYYERADIVVDQLLVGWYGGLAVEAMALGKPVIAYVREEDLQFVPPAMREELPVVSANATTLRDVLRELVLDPARRRNLGFQSRKFVEKWHHPKVVGEITTAAYREALGTKRTRPITKRDRFHVLAKIALQFGSQLTSLFLTGWKHRARVAWRRLQQALFRVLLIAAAPLIWAAGQFRLRMLRRPSSVWGITPILILPVLARADRLLGMRSLSVAYSSYVITSSFDVLLQRWVEKLAARAPFLLPGLYRVAFLWALLKFDVFHFFFDQGFLERDGRFGVSETELRLLRRFGKRVYLYAYGADVRTRAETMALGQYNCCVLCTRVMVNCVCDSAEARRKQAYYARYATALIAMGDMTAYVPGARNTWYWPIDVDRIRYVGVHRQRDRPLRIFHAPNHAWAKGSQFLVDAVSRLRAAGEPVELISVSGVSNAEVLKHMSACDIVADQFLIGWHGYTALEALAQGKVVLCFIRNRDMLLAPDECPILSADPESLESLIRELVRRSPEDLQRLGKQGRSYVEKHYSIAAVARRLQDLYLETAGFPQGVRRRLQLLNRIGAGAERVQCQ